MRSILSSVAGVCSLFFLHFAQSLMCNWEEIMNFQHPLWKVHFKHILTLLLARSLTRAPPYKRKCFQNDFEMSLSNYLQLKINFPRHDLPYFGPLKMINSHLNHCIYLLSGICKQNNWNDEMRVKWKEDLRRKRFYDCRKKKEKKEKMMKFTFATNK